MITILGTSTCFPTRRGHSIPVMIEARPDSAPVRHGGIHVRGLESAIRAFPMPSLVDGPGSSDAASLSFFRDLACMSEYPTLFSIQVLERHKHGYCHISSHNR